MNFYLLPAVLSDVRLCAFECASERVRSCAPGAHRDSIAAAFLFFISFPAGNPSSISAEGAVWLLRAEEAACSFSQSQLQVTFSDEEHDDTLPTFKPQEG